MKSDPDTKWLIWLAPGSAGRKLKYSQRRIQANGGFGTFLVPGRPISQERIADIFIDDTTGGMHNVPRIAKPVTEQLSNLLFAKFFRHRCKSSDIANQNGDRKDCVTS